MQSIKINNNKKNPKKSRTFHHQQGYRIVGDRNIFFRSSWEVNYACSMELLKKAQQILDWEYEPKTFWFEDIKRGVRSYKPDFKITKLDGTHYWVEVKGYLDSKSKTKLKRFKKYYPEEELILKTKNT